MKIKLEIEADEAGYTEKVYVDGVLKNECTHVATPSGTKRTSGKDYDEVFDDDDLISALDGFTGFDLFLHCNKQE